MDLTRISENIRLSKLDNRRWLEYANALIEGTFITEEGVPNYSDECIACQWLYDHSDDVTQLYQKMNKSEIDLFYFDIMEEIEILRYDLHENYLQIFKTYLPELNHSFFANLFRAGKGVSEYDRIEAKRLFVKMQEIVEELDNKLDQLERSVSQLCKLHSA